MRSTDRVRRMELGERLPVIDMAGRSWCAGPVRAAIDRDKTDDARSCGQIKLASSYRPGS